MTQTEWVSVIGAIGALLVAIGSLAVSFSQRRKNVADAGEAAAKSVGLLLVPLNDKLEELTKELAAAKGKIETLQTASETEQVALKKEREEWHEQRKQMQAEIDELRGGVTVLVAQLEAANIQPRYKPKTGPLKDT